MFKFIWNGKYFYAEHNQSIRADKFGNIYGGGGGGTEINQAPTTPAPNPSETAEAQYKARLAYDPKVAQMEMDIQKQMLPQQAALYQSMYNQYYPEMARQQQALQRELYPQQSQILEAGATKALERINAPDYMTEAERVAQTAEREKAVTDLQEAMRTRANLGGGLYGGRSAAAEARDVGSMLNQFQMQDYQNRMTNAYNAQQALNPYMQILYPQIGTTQPQYSPYQYQSAVPSADNLYNAYFQASQPQYFASQEPDRTGQLIGAGAGLGSAAIMAA